MFSDGYDQRGEGQRDNDEMFRGLTNYQKDPRSFVMVGMIWGTSMIWEMICMGMILGITTSGGQLWSQVVRMMVGV